MAWYVADPSATPAVDCELRARRHFYEAEDGCKPSTCRRHGRALARSAAEEDVAKGLLVKALESSPDMVLPRDGAIQSVTVCFMK
jgi:hypothetical protein